MSLELGNIRDEAVKLIEGSDSPEKLDEIKVTFLGKKGKLTEILVHNYVVHPTFSEDLFPELNI